MAAGGSAVSADARPSAFGRATNGVPQQVLRVFSAAGPITQREERMQYYRAEFAALGQEGIDFLLEELKKPTYVPGGRGRRSSRRTFVREARQVIPTLGDDAFAALVTELAKNGRPYFKVNAIHVFWRSDHLDSFDALASCLNDFRNAKEDAPRVEEPGGIDAGRVAWKAYHNLLSKLKRSGLPPPKWARSLGRIPWEDRDAEALRLQKWWQENRATILAQYRELQTERAKRE